MSNILVRWLYNRYYWIRGFIYGLRNEEWATDISARVRACDDCSESLCEKHKKEVNEKVYNKG